MTHLDVLQISNLYDKRRHSYTYIYVKLPIAGQTAGPIGLTFFADSHGGRWCYRLKKSKFFLKHFFHIFFSNFFPWATLGPSASTK